MKRFLPLIVLLTLAWAGCGGGKSSTTSTTVAVTISPTTASIAGGATQQFTATVTPTTNTAVTWQVNGENGGDAIIGTVSSSGLYTAPTVLPSTTTVTVTAISQADTTKSASATVTLTAPTVTISISPTSATVAAGGSVQFTPTVTSTDNNTAVSWSVNGCAVSATCGSVSSTGLYTAPLSPPKESITVTATSKSNATFTASAPITVQFGNGSLNGQYVFLVTQADNSSGSGFAFRAGEFAADGAGHLTSGVSDANSSASGPAAKVPFTGTYSVGADGRGTATINDASGAHTFSFALTSSTRGQIIEFDSAAAAAGYIRQQDQTAIANVTGTFVFSLSGDNAGPAAAVGQMSLASAAITGTQDTNSSGTLSQQFGIVGSYALGAAGRGTATITNPSGTSQYAFYIIDASTLALVDSDASGFRTAGTAFAQTGAPFSNASLGSSAYFVSGNAIPGSKPLAQAGRFDTNATGGFSNGIFDLNNGGNPSSAPFASGATYSVSPNGRVQISTGTSNFIAWMSSSKQGVILQSDTSAVASGLLLQQQINFQSVTGGYAFVIAGANSVGTPAQGIDGQVTTSGFGVLSGTEDVNTGGTLQTGQSLSGSLPPLTNGRAAGAILGVNFDFYFVTPDRFILLSAGSGSVLSGVAERQCSDCQF